MKTLRKFFHLKDESAKGKSKVSKAKLDTLNRAISIEDYAACIRLVEQDIGLDYRDVLGNTVLHSAAIKRSFLVPILLKKGLDPNALNEWQETPLHIAVSCGYNITQYDRRQFPSLSALTVHDEFLKKIRDQVLDRSLVPEDCIKILLQNGSNVHAQLSDKKEPLIVAIRHDAPLSVVGTLLRFGGNPLQRDHTGKTALMWAYELGNIPCVEYLKRYLQFFLLLTASMTKAGKNSVFYRLPIELIRELYKYLYRS